MVKKETKQRPGKTPLWEWVFAAIGVVLVVGAVSMMIYRGLTQDEIPAHFSITAGTVILREDTYIVPFTIRNLGTQTAAEVAIEGSLNRGEQAVATSSVTLTYVPANSEREGVVLFTKNPQEFDFKLRVLGYEKP